MTVELFHSVGNMAENWILDWFIKTLTLVYYSGWCNVVVLLKYKIDFSGSVLKRVRKGERPQTLFYESLRESAEKGCYFIQ